MTLARGVILVLLVAAIGVGVWRFTADDNGEPKPAPIPAAVTDLKPAADAPDGYRWDHHNGGEFVIWRLVDKVAVGDAPRSGLAVHFSRVAKAPPEKNATSKRGRFAGQDVAWFTLGPPETKTGADKTTKDAGKDAKSDEDGDDEKVAIVQLRQDAYLDFKDAAAEPLKVHVWIWADTAPRLGELEKLAEAMTFISASKK
jgi:hypothetical protein